MYKIHQNYITKTTINNINSAIDKWWDPLDNNKEKYSRNLIWYAIFKCYLNDIKKLHKEAIDIRKKENQGLQEF